MVVRTELYAHLNINWNTSDLTQGYTYNTMVFLQVHVNINIV